MIHAHSSKSTLCQNLHIFNPFKVSPKPVFNLCQELIQMISQSLGAKDGPSFCLDRIRLKSQNWAYPQTLFRVLQI